MSLDPLIHSPVRLRLMGLLNQVDSVEFSLARDELGVGDSTLSQAAAALAEAGFVKLTKRRVGRSTRTWFELTPEGRRALKDYVQEVRSITNL